jgi:Colicin-E5 Imm protein
MTAKEFTYNDLFDDGKAFFEKNGNATMVLTPKAAKEVCEEATVKGIYIGTIEGGHWMSPGFRPDMHTRWDSIKFYKDIDVKTNNYRAIENIDEDISEGYTAFLITVIKHVN